MSPPPHPTIRFFGGIATKSRVNLRMKCIITAADAIRVVRVPLGGAACGLVRVERQDQRSVGQETVAANLVDYQYVGIGEARVAALIGTAAIEKAIADHPFARFQRGLDQSLDVIAAGGGKKQGFRLG